MEYALKLRGYEDTTIQQVMPIWEKHHKACESLNQDELNEIADEIFRMREFIDTFALPNTYQEFASDSNLYFLKPMYSSMPNDYLTELAKLDVPWLAIYGEQDPVINVKESIANIQKQMAAAQNHDCEIVRIKDVGHSFEYPGTRDYVRVENIIVNWLNKRISNH
jgi:pimeloyl-ACP methyl ester carboxylesterase